MVLKCAFDELMQEIGTEQLVYVRAWKIIGEWLENNAGSHIPDMSDFWRQKTYRDIIDDTK